jgi:parallel beta-helix repeat protein/predicted outer membrane repeat protein
MVRGPRSVNILFYSFTVLLTLQGALLAATINVPGDQPTIQAGIDAAVSGVDEVVVAAGSYLENINLNGQAITLRSADGAATTTIDGTLIGPVITCSSGEGAGTVIQGFTILNGQNTFGGGLVCTSASPTVIDCIFRSNRANQHGGAVACQSNANPTFTNCLFTLNIANTRGGVFYNDSSSPTITNCTLVNNQGFMNGAVFNQSGSAVMANSVIWSNMPPLSQISDFGGLMTVSFSNIQDNWTGSGTNNISLNPQFVDRPNGDFHLLDTSPCIDAGDNTAVPAGITTDLDGTTRFRNIPLTPDTGQGTPPMVDMGVFEAFADCNGNQIPDDEDLDSDNDDFPDDCDICPGFDDLVDTDGDGVPNGCDICPGFDDNGPDGDGDSVPDSCDACPGFDDTLDADGDTIPDNCDACPGFDDTLDADGDTIPDDCDVCPGFDDTLDGDGDGLPDGCDTPTVHNLTQATDHFTLQVAIDASVNGDEIEADPGTYAEAINFNGKAISLRSVSGDPNDTVIDGIGNFHVVQCISGEEPNTLLHGFTITGGNADGASLPDNIGGGMLNDNSSPTVTRCTFSGNSAVFGGGMHNRNNSNPTVTNCSFNGNSASLIGGGMVNFFGSSPTVTHCYFRGNTSDNDSGGIRNDAADTDPTVSHCTFSGNTASVGGAMVNTSSSSPTVINCFFDGNTAMLDGGGMYNATGSNLIVASCTFVDNSAVSGGGMYNLVSSTPTVVNCIFSGNTVTGDGGGMRNTLSSNPLVNNCTFSGNTAILDGGGMSNDGASTNSSVSNSIFWGNSDNGGMTDESAQIHVSIGAETPTVTYSNVMGGWTGVGGTSNINADPLFADADGSDNIPGTLDDNLRLQAGSPCIDAGNSLFVQLLFPTDLDGNARIADDPATADTGIAVFGLTVDMGAYEFGSSPDPCENAIEGDINCDGIVNELDFALMALHWLETM